MYPGSMSLRGNQLTARDNISPSQVFVEGAITCEKFDLVASQVRSPGQVTGLNIPKHLRFAKIIVVD